MLVNTNTTYDYNSNGNILTDGLEGVAMEYDINNMVRRVKTSLGDTLATYLYFADGEKYGVTTAPRYLYNGKEKQEFIHNTNSVLNAAGSANTGLILVNINSTRDALIQAYPWNAAAFKGLPANYNLRTLKGIYYKR